MKPDPVIPVKISSAEIYEPAEDSYLLERFVRKNIVKGMSVLDVGTGSGIQARASLESGATVTALDLNPNAISFCKKDTKLSDVTFIESDLFCAFDDKRVKPLFDIIIFNPPYLPRVNEPEKIQLYTTGGKHGYEIIDRFLSHADEYLKPEGSILIVFSSLTKKMKVDEAIVKYGFKFEPLEEVGMFFERLYCYKITRSEVLERCRELSISGLILFSKGRRGLIFKGRYKGKLSIIKSVNPEAQSVVNTLENEAFWLKVVNKLKIGPRLYYADEQIVVMEFLDGEFIVDYIERNKDKKSKISKVLMEIFDQMIVLDDNQLEKLEMTRPLRHIIVCKDRPVLIDFERTRKTLRASNVTQYLQFLSCNILNDRFIRIDRNEIIHLSKELMVDHDYDSIREYLEKCLSG